VLSFCLFTPASTARALYTPYESTNGRNKLHCVRARIINYRAVQPSFSGTQRSHIGQSEVEAPGPLPNRRTPAEQDAIKTELPRHRICRGGKYRFAVWQTLYRPRERGRAGGAARTAVRRTPPTRPVAPVSNTFSRPSVAIRVRCTAATIMLTRTKTQTNTGTQQQLGARTTTTSGSVGSNAAYERAVRARMCGNGCMSVDGGCQGVRAAGENLQIRTLLKKKNSFYIVNSGTF
jgi:hypothetical protein